MTEQAQALRILIVEDSEDDALLIVRQLRRGGFDIHSERVSSASELASALRDKTWDVIITDHTLPDFDSLGVLQVVKELGLDVPVIIVSGSIGEDIAVSCMKAGAHDYIMKGSLARLVPAVDRELREARRRRAHRDAEKAIHHMAFHDSLTGLVNRREFERRLHVALQDAASMGKQYGLLYLDLDQFKVINDTSGHVAGDELLRQVAGVLSAQIRDSDTLARLGGDEFGILLYNCPMARAQEIAWNILGAIQDFRFTWADKVFSIGGSIGLVHVDDVNARLTDVLRAADMACYMAKERGRNRVHVFTPGDADLVRHQSEMEWATRIRHALDEDRLLFHRQRIVALARDAPEQSWDEVLLRLSSEDGELALPGAFLPAAERYGLMPAVDRWVVEQGLRYARERAEGGGPGGMVFINLSGASLGDEDFCRFVEDRIGADAQVAGAVCFEITETAAIANLSRAVNFAGNVRKQGCRFALDDFGSGMSSFSYLKAIPVDYLKIDGAFVRDILVDPMDCAIVEAINHIGHLAGLKIIAEGVESAEVLEALRELGVDYAQGYHIHRPCAPEAE